MGVDGWLTKEKNVGSGPLKSMCGKKIDEVDRGERSFDPQGKGS